MHMGGLHMRTYITKPSKCVECAYVYMFAARGVPVLP